MDYAQILRRLARARALSFSGDALKRSSIFLDYVLFGRHVPWLWNSVQVAVEGREVSPQTITRAQQAQRGVH